MWRQLSRGLLKENLGRGLTAYNPAQRKLPQQWLDITRSVPRLVDQIRLYHKNARGGCCCNSGSQHGKKKERNDSPLNDVEYQFLEALGWSSVFLIGWYICHPLRRNRLWPNQFEKDKTISTLRRETHTDFLNKTVKSITTTNLINYVLPKASAAKKSTQQRLNVEPSRDEVLRLGVKQLEEAHEIVLGKLDNWLGTECMQSGEHMEGANYFTKAVKLENASAMFNLGICYETGLGKKQNFKKAAALYRKASDLGHATAMYNLGVFHVHGWGGVETNAERAKQLFKQAANLGQKEAINALSLSYENKNLINDNEQVTMETKSRTYSEGFSEGVEPGLYSEENYSFKIEPKSIDNTDILFNVLGISFANFNSAANVTADGEAKKSVDSGVLDLTQEKNSLSLQF